MSFTTNFVKDMSEIAKGLELDAADLRQLERAFRETGNDRVAERLGLIAHSIAATAGAVRDVRSETVDGLLGEAKAQTSGILHALLEPLREKTSS